MDNSLYLLAASMDLATGEQRRIAGNLANAQTSGFKAVMGRVEGSKRPFVEDSQEIFANTFPQQKTSLSFLQGELENSGDPMDIALWGNAFLALKDGDSTRYMRSGHLRLDPKGYLVNSSGLRIMGENGPIQLDAQKISELKIDSDGRVSQGKGSSQRLKFVTFDTPEKLISQEGTYINPKGLKEQAASAIVYQEHLEKSNVDSISTMADLVGNMRYFESVYKVTRAVDESFKNLLNL